MQNGDGYRPNFALECTKCGGTPCVDVVRSGRIAHQSLLCGVCFFHDRTMVDWNFWNDKQEDSE